MTGAPVTSGSTLVEVRDVVKTYRRGPERVHALAGVTFDLRRHEVVGLVGPSGSGKTTLLNVLCGWERADSGTIRWPGSEDVPAGARPWSELAILPQRLGLIEELTTAENVDLPVRLRRSDRRAVDARAATLLETLGLDALAGREPAEVSLGEQQRVALARALVLGPRLLLADEPTGHQDEGWAKAVFEAIRRAAEDGTSCLVATHNEQIREVADRVFTIRDGTVHAQVARR